MISRSRPGLTSHQHLHGRQFNPAGPHKPEEKQAKSNITAPPEPTVSQTKPGNSKRIGGANPFRSEGMESPSHAPSADHSAGLDSLPGALAIQDIHKPTTGRTWIWKVYQLHHATFVDYQRQRIEYISLGAYWNDCTLKMWRSRTIGLGLTSNMPLYSQRSDVSLFKSLFAQDILFVLLRTALLLYLHTPSSLSRTVSRTAYLPSTNFARLRALANPGRPFASIRASTPTNSSPPLKT